MQNTSRIPARYLLVLLLLITLPACVDRPSEDVEDEATREDIAGRAQGDVERAPGTPPPPPATALENEVRVNLTSYAIEIPSPLPAGLTDFKITNYSTGEQHSFFVEGEGITAALEDPIPPGESMMLRVALQPGTYRVYCPVENHAARGMTETLVVQEDVNGDTIDVE